MLYRCSRVSWRFRENIMLSSLSVSRAKITRPLKTEAVNFFETSRKSNPTTQLHIAEDPNSEGYIFIKVTRRTVKRIHQCTRALKVSAFFLSVLQTTRPLQLSEPACSVHSLCLPAKYLADLINFMTPTKGLLTELCHLMLWAVFEFYNHPIAGDFVLRIPFGLLLPHRVGSNLCDGILLCLLDKFQLLESHHSIYSHLLF
jgi:hypothetical protein